MKKTKKLTTLLFLFCSLFLYLTVFFQPAKAADSLAPAAQDNLNVNLRRTSDQAIKNPVELARMQEIF